jgi:hypothetical protein
MTAGPKTLRPFQPSTVTDVLTGEIIVKKSTPIHYRHALWPDSLFPHRTDSLVLTHEKMLQGLFLQKS